MLQERSSLQLTQVIKIKRSDLQGFDEIANVLLSNGADKDSLSDDYCTPLYYSVLGQQLLSKGRIKN